MPVELDRLSNEQLLPLTRREQDGQVRRQACEILYERLAPKLIKWVEDRLGGARNGDKKYEPKDAVQMFFVHVLEGKIAAKYDGRSPVGPFFRRIIENAAIDCVKREARYVSPKNEASAITNGAPLTLDIAEVRERLSDEEKLVCDEYFEENKSAQEVADAHPERHWTVKEVYAIAERVRRHFSELGPGFLLSLLSVLD